MRYLFEELIDVAKLQKLMDSLYAAIGLPSAIITTDGKVLVKSGWNKLCTDFHRKNQTTEKLCIESDTRILDRLDKGEQYVTYKCPLGLIDSSSPIVISNEHVANVFTGQFLDAPITEETENYFRNQAKKYGFDEELYISTFKETPIVNDVKHTQMLDILVNLAQMISSASLTRKIELEKEKVIKESEEKFSKAFYFHPTAMEIVNINTGKRLEVNDKFIELFEFSKDEFINKNAFDQNIWVNNEARDEGLRLLLKDRVLTNYRMDTIVKSGKTKNVLLNATLLNLDEEGIAIVSYLDITKQIEDENLLKEAKIENEKKIVELNKLNIKIADEQKATLNILSDLSFEIDERKKAEIELKKSENKFKASFLTSPDSININRLEDGVYVEVNSGFLKITGYSREEVIGKSSKEIDIWANPKDRNRLVSGLKKDGFVQNLQSKFRMKDGTVLDALMSASIIEIENKPHILSVTRDITEIVEARELLQKSEERFIKLSELTTEGVLISKDGIVFDSNKAFQDIIGYRNEEIIEKNIIELVVPPKYHQQIYTNIKNNYRQTYEIEVIRKDGKLIPVELEAREIEYSFGDKLLKNVSVTTIRDISLRKKQEQEISKLTNAIEQSITSIVITDTMGDIEYVNKYFMETTGYTREEAYGQNPRILKTDYLDDSVYKDLWATISSGKTWTGEFHNKKKNGEFYWEKAVISPIKDNDGKIVNYVAIKEDITEWKKTEEERLHLEQLVINSVNEIYIIDTDSFTFTFLNNSALKNIGYTLDEIESLPPIDILPEFTEKELRSLVEPLFKREAQFVKIETLHQRKDKSFYPIEASLFLVKYGDSERLVSIVINISKRKKAEKEVLEYQAGLEEKIIERTEEISAINEMLKIEIERKERAEKRTIKALEKEKELNQIKDQFMSTISHDLRTPLTAIQSSVDLMERFYGKWEKEKVINKYEQIKSSVSRINEMLNHVLKLSKIERGLVVTKFETVNLKNELNTVFEEIELLKSEKHRLAFNYLLDKENYRVDIHLIRDIISNLLSNGIKYSPDGGEVTLNVEGDSEWLRFTVTDEGMGIDESEVKLIFNDYFRTESSQHIEGTGLGLSIVKNYVEIYKGTIEVESSLGKGTKFIVKLPI